MDPRAVIGVGWVTVAWLLDDAKGKRMGLPNIKPGQNLGKGVLLVEHYLLTPAGEPGQLKSVCPKCKMGTLACIRDPQTMELLPNDNCLLCGQWVRYTDIDRMREQDPWFIGRF